METSKNLKEQILKILEKYPATRNSDRLLHGAILKKFYSHLLIEVEKNGEILFCLPVTERNSVHYNRVTEEFRKIPLGETVKRHRARIQNHDGKFLPTDPKVAKQRGIKQEAIQTYYSTKK